MGGVGAEGGLRFAAGYRAVRDPRRGDERGEALPVAILFLGVFFTVMVAVHVVIVAVARSAVQSAADRALVAAQSADPGDVDCDGVMRPDRECRGILEARLAMIAARGSVIETRLPAVAVEEDRGTVTVLVFGGIISPVLGGVELTGQACGPLDSVSVSELTAADSDLWRC
ncbi:MAG: hypothetical protein OXC06_00100 [Acidimicrobiaceae bacterium]|nr:hypothetical protein [Acidimicrobiaceae bacterium]